MAWIVKNSAQDQQQRDEPYLDKTLRQHLEQKVVGRFPNRQAATLPVLHAIQEEHGWLPHQAIAEAADFLEVSAVEVLDTASFYEEFWLEPKGKYVIWICQSLACELLGHERLLERISEKLGIVPGQSTDDGKFTLMIVECLGSCGTAPCALVNQTLHENLNAHNLDEILDSLE